MTGFSSAASILMVGSSIASAPFSLSIFARPELSSLGLVTTALTPASGRSSSQLKSSDSAATSPTTMTAGITTLAFFAASASPSTVEEMILCAAVVPFSMTAAGVSGSMPPPIRPFISTGSEDIPIRNTIVPPASASAAKSMSYVWSFLLWPVTTCTLEQ